jgi:hypothetical protein
MYFLILHRLLPRWRRFVDFDSGKEPVHGHVLCFSDLTFFLARVRSIGVSTTANQGNDMSLVRLSLHCQLIVSSEKLQAEGASKPPAGSMTSGEYVEVVRNLLRDPLRGNATVAGRSLKVGAVSTGRCNTI